MRSVILAVAGLICSVVWLGLLVATHFNVVTVSAGLLVVVYTTGSSAPRRPNVAPTHRRH
ncbi:MAG: hypothetical protein JOZ41_08000 [Chloroflexi bacterium]|nr:hypothetical protein [Chloroflexota bacterium]